MPDGSLDTNIIMGAKPVQIDNPLDQGIKAMTMKDLMQRGQIQGLQQQQAQQDWNDSQSIRQATSDNTTVNSDNSTSFDQGGFLKQIASANPALLPKAQQQLAQQNVNTLENHKKLNDMAIQYLNGVHDQPTLDSAIAGAKANGLPVNNISPIYDPNNIKMALAQSMNTKDYLEQQTKDTGQAIENKKLDFEIAKYGNDKQTEAFKDLMAHAESSRQLPDVKQAYTDRYNAQKVLDLVGQGDPNKLNPNMVQLVSGEIAKIAQGGVPQTEELKNITPQDANMLLARTKQYLTNHPQASQQGAFINVFKDYANTIQGNANKVIGTNMGQLGDSYKDHLKDSDYQNFQNTFIKGNPNSLKQTNDAISGKSDQSQSQKTDYSVNGVKSMKVGAVLNGMTKTKDGWVPLDASK